MEPQTSVMMLVFHFLIEQLLHRYWFGLPKAYPQLFEKNEHLLTYLPADALTT